MQSVRNTASNALTQASSALSNASAAQQTADGKADAVHTHAAADTTSGVFDLERIPTIPASKLSGTLDIAGGGTGANNAVDAANNLEVYYLGVREPIPTNADLNNYKTVGSYASPSNSMAATVINAPMNAPIAFILTVEKTLANGSTANYFRQIFHDRTGKIYTRFIEGDTWSDWVKIATETDLDDYLPLTGGTLRGSVTIGNAGESTYRDFKIRRKSTSSNLQRDAVFTTDGESTAIGLSGEPEQGESQTALNYLRLYPDRTEMTKALTISSGGTGANTAKAAQHNLLSGMNSATDTPTDDSDIVFAYDASTSNNGAIFKRPLSSLWTWIKSKADSIYAAVNHTHTIASVSNLQEELNSKAETLSDLGVTATAEELNYIEGVTANVQVQINGKAPSSHKHTVSDISDFPDSMPASDVSSWAKAASKPSYTANEVGAAPSTHNHAITDVEGLQTALDGKANSSHTHAMSDITGLPLETIYTNSNQSLSGTTSKVLNIYKFCGIALVDVYVYVASFTKPSSYTEKTVLTLNLPSGIKLEPSGIEGYPSLRIWNDLCITANVTESATGTPQVNSAGTAIVFKGFFGGGGSTKAQAWRTLFTATLQ